MSKVTRQQRGLPDLKVTFRLILFITLLSLGSALPLTASAQGTATGVISNEVEVDFPDSVTFRLQLEEDIEAEEVELIYQVGRDSCITAGTLVPVEAQGSILEWTWVMSRSGNPPPGAQLWWEWVVTDEAGNRITTERETLTFADDRYDWRSINSNDSGQGAPSIVLHWYEGDKVGPVLLEAAEDGLGRLEQDVGIELDGQVQIFVYGDAAEMREALLFVQDWAGGLAFSDFNTILLGVPPDLADSWGSDTIRHELAHLVIGQFGRSCLGGSRPTWLEEGLATYAEGEPEQEILDDIEEGIEDNSFLPVRSLSGSFPAHSDGANFAYSQSFSLVEYLLEIYGQEALQDLILELASGESYDGALENVYGFNADGLERTWREAIGAPPRLIPATPTPVLAALVPTVVPLDAARSFPTPESTDQPGIASATDSSGGGEAADEVGENPSSNICGFGLAAPLLLGVSGVIVLRKRRSSA